MQSDDQQLDELTKITDSYVSLSELTVRLQADYLELSKKFEKQSLQLEEINNQVTRALEANSRLSTYLNNILECLDAGVVVFSIDGKICLFNRAAEKLTGISRQEAIEKHYTTVFPGDEHESTFSLLDGTETKSHGEKWFGSQPVGYSSSRIFDENGSCCGVVEILYDISGEKRLRETIRQVSALAALGEMSAIVAHQIRNPLAGIIGFANLLQRDLPYDHPSAHLAQKIFKGSKELNRIMTNLLDYTKQTKPDFRELDLIKFTKEVISSFSNEPVAEKMKIVFQTDTDEVLYRFDPVLFRQAFLNIIENAVQAMEPNGGKLTLSVKTEGGQCLKIVFKDTGMGFQQGDCDKLFKPFYTTRRNGTGLGLSMVKKMIDFHNGTIRANSPAGGGAEFTIELPL
jgi:two-component system sensor histidine kinase AtoS